MISGCPISNHGSPARDQEFNSLVKTKLQGVNQLDYLTGKSEKSARDTLFYYGGSAPSAVSYKNWKIYYTM